jgi:hypothetical protein
MNKKRCVSFNDRILILFIEKKCLQTKSNYNRLKTTFINYKNNDKFFENLFFKYFLFD